MITKIKGNIRSLSFAFILLCASASFYITGCSSAASPIESNPEKFQVINPTILDTVYTNEYVAEIQSVQNVEIRARVKGFIENIYVDEGKSVQAGQVIFTLSSREFKEDLLQANAQLKSAVAELKSAEVAMKNTKILVDKNIIAKSELELAQAKKEALAAKIEETKSAIAVAQLNLSFTQVKAPFTGVINRIPNKTGSLVEEGTLLTTISNNKEVFAYFNVSEKEYLDFAKQKELGRPQAVSLQMADGDLFPHKGTVETTENEIDKSTGSLAFRARFANPQQVLKHGSTAKVLMNKEVKNVLAVPQKSTFEVQDKINVYVVDANNVVRIKSFVPKLRLPHLFIVESGLDKEDKIIYEGVQLVKEGEKVVPELISFNQATAQLAMQ
jgi:RND family efflux transporter MFP subunit